MGTDREGSKHFWKRTQEETLEVRRQRKFASQQRIWQENKDLFNSVSTGTSLLFVWLHLIFCCSLQTHVATGETRKTRAGTDHGLRKISSYLLPIIMKYLQLLPPFQVDACLPYHSCHWSSVSEPLLVLCFFPVIYLWFFLSTVLFVDMEILFFVCDVHIIQESHSELSAHVDICALQEWKVERRM